jgi:hypothetical protein
LLGEQAMKISFHADHPEFISILAPEIAAHWGGIILVKHRITPNQSPEPIPASGMSPAGPLMFGNKPSLYGYSAQLSSL